MGTTLSGRPNPVVESGRDDLSVFCPECGQPLDQWWRHSRGDFFDRPFRSSGLMVAGLLLFALVVIRTWTAGSHLPTVERRADTFAIRLSPLSLARSGDPTIAGSDEEYLLLADLVRTRNHLSEGSIGALLALAVVGAGLGPRERGGRIARRMWRVGHSVLVVVTLVFALGFGWSAASFLFKGMAFTPLLLDLAFSRTVELVLAFPNLPTL